MVELAVVVGELAPRSWSASPWSSWAHRRRLDTRHHGRRQHRAHPAAKPNNPPEPDQPIDLAASIAGSPACTRLAAAPRSARVAPCYQRGLPRAQVAVLRGQQARDDRLRRRVDQDYHVRRPSICHKARPWRLIGRRARDRSRRWLADRAVEAGGLLDLSATVSVRTPGHPGSGHLPRWHLWYRTDPGHPVRIGPLARCHAVELRTRGTCPGSPGYVVWSEPDHLPVLPRWIAGLAGPPMPVTSTVTGRSGGGTWTRLHGITGRLLAARRGERNRAFVLGQPAGG